MRDSFQRLNLTFLIHCRAFPRSQNDPYGPKDSESNFGTVNGTLLPDGSATPYQPLTGYMAAVALQNGVGNGTFAGRLAATINDWDADPSDVFVLQFDGAAIARAAGFPAFAVWTNVSMCLGEGPRYPCPGVPPAGANLYSCIEAGCCYDETAADATKRCYKYPYADEPLQAQFSLPAAVPAGTCFNVVDWVGIARGQACASAGALIVNVTDGPSYFF